MQASDLRVDRLTSKAEMVEPPPRIASAWTGEVGSVGSMSFTCIDPGLVRKTTLTICLVFVMIVVSRR